MRIAHLSDVHMLEPWSTAGLDVRFVSFGRSLDAEARMTKLEAALRRARARAADHVIISGDLTETGTPGQFETFATVLGNSGWDPDDVTIVPGNHDAYASPDGWKRALEGPLRPWAATAATRPGKVVERAGVTILPIDVSVHQPVTRSSGEIREDQIHALAQRLRDSSLRKQPIVVVQHHPPYAHSNRVWHWLDGLRGYAPLVSLLEEQNVYVLHGHLHVTANRMLGATRVFGVTATVEDEAEAPRISCYDVVRGELAAA